MVRKSGSITVFLSLVSILLVALLGTIVEGARYTVCKNHVKRTIRTATESLMTEYNRPLYENYGLFFIESEGTPYHQVIAKYAADTMESAKEGNKDFLNGHITDVNVKNKKYVGDNQAEALQTEICDYMGRIVTKESFQKMKKEISSVENIDKEAKQIEKTVEKEKEAAKFDQQLLRLMYLVDGISIRRGRVVCANNFIKVFATKKIESHYFSINDATVWKKIKPKLDKRTKTWKIKDKEKFLVKLEEVIKITNEAIQTITMLGDMYVNGNSSQIKNVMAGLPKLKCNLTILKKTKELLKKFEIKQAKKQLKTIWKDYDTTSICFDYSGVQEKGGADNPKDSLKSGWKNGILNLVCKDVNAISNQSISPQYAQKKESIVSDCVENFLSKEMVNLSSIGEDVSTYSLESFCLDQYVQKKFGNYTKKMSGWKEALAYGVEYVVAGKESDRENLKAILHRILLIRTTANFRAIYADKAKNAEAKLAAIGIVGFTGLQPLIALTKTFILLTWAIVESLVDIAGLLLQKDVPLIKKSSQITTHFHEIFQVSNRAIIKRASKLKKETRRSFGYSGYLTVFLALTNKTTRLYRVMDLIQANMRKNGYSRFFFGGCVYEIDVEATMCFPTKFFRLNILEKMSGRNLKNHIITTKIRVSY